VDKRAVRFFKRCADGRITLSFQSKNFSKPSSGWLFDPANANRDLLVLMMESYAQVIGVPPIEETLVEKLGEPHYVPEISSIPKVEAVADDARSPRAPGGTDCARAHEKDAAVSVYYVVAHWRAAAKLARKIRKEIPGLVVGYEDLALVQDVDAKGVRLSRNRFRSEVVLIRQRSADRGAGNSAAAFDLPKSARRRSRVWKNELHEDEVGWVEWHCRDLMPEFGYEPRLNRRSLRYFMKPIRGERPKEFLKSRAYSLRDRLKH